ncbi:MAG: hypothetical protein HQM10_07385 [Candidatus Riflebacteria bacterium]|nr:hypothetical protein [Candidatus Riflebacteria bacterium]
MTIGDTFIAFMRAVFVYKTVIFAVAIIFPIVGAVFAAIGKRGKTDRDGRFVANFVIGASLLFFILETIILFIAHRFFSANLIQADAMLVASGPLCLAGSLFFIKLIFPLTELTIIHSIADFIVLLIFCSIAFWFISKFRGWGIYFFGGITEMITIGIVMFVFLGRLFSRFSKGRLNNQ